MIVAFAWIWRTEKILRKISPRLSSRRTAMRLNQHAAHARFSKLGQELEQHLEMEMREREVAMKLRSRLRQLEKTHRTNVTRALDAAAIGSDAFTFEARNAVVPYVESAIESFFDELREVLEQRIVSPMLSTSSAAFDRHKELHDEILDELRRDRDERQEFLAKRRNLIGDLDGDGFVEDRDYDGFRDVPWHEQYDDSASEVRDEEWRKAVITNFEGFFKQHFNDSFAIEHNLQPHNLLQTSDALLHKLVDLQKRLGVRQAYLEPNDNTTAPTLSWRDAEVEIGKLKPELQRHRCHVFKPSPPPQDDVFDYEQLHNVGQFLSEMIWHAKLNSHRHNIQAILDALHAGEVGNMETIEALERAEGDGAFPSFWLYHPHLDDYGYGNW